VQQLAANSARAAISGLDLAERQALVEQHLASSLPDGGLLTRDAVSVSVETLEDDSSYLRVVVPSTRAICLSGTSIAGFLYLKRQYAGRQS
jgi:hypothetical protein